MRANGRKREKGINTISYVVAGFTENLFIKSWSVLAFLQDKRMYMSTIKRENECTFFLLGSASDDLSCRGLFLCMSVRHARVLALAHALSR